ncbi:bifunctional 2-polyprenyl-6-hydroxyphenol methylase/3-demethylubiquinol 3-O-methyltransferase UbiG [Thalassococcus sp. S3]|uniref:class I SAM-dependent methyltransferase n=1 Tax=Thalassococcus sp. S3 TaxID=2017482 RepID=UPI001023F8EA|nr:class I SAM-dependent methyltransferase [Thalassococcus sp. S3]QBF33898.1 SAM-dependent methyltransferase [Thalassococcus sp. S3]
MTGLGWDHSAPGWLAHMGEGGDPTRLHIFDAPMLDALPETGRALDIGCGEGRFCRMMRARGLDPVGLDPTQKLLEAARQKDPESTYVEGRAEALPFEDATFDVAVFYFSLIDIPDMRAAIAEAARILRPGGRVLIANLHSFVTASPPSRADEKSLWIEKDGQRLYMGIDEMMTERDVVFAWGDIRIVNHHRPLSAYMTALLNAGLTLRQFTDPPYTGPDPDFRRNFNRMPWAFQMVWDKT